MDVSNINPTTSSPNPDPQIAKDKIFELSAENIEEGISQIKRGDVGFEVEPNSEKVSHKVIKLAQKVFVSKGETNIIHSFVVIKVDPKQKIIYVAEASGQRGLVETAYHVNEFVKAHTRFLIYQNKSEHFREIYATVAEKQIDKIINGLEQKNNLYSRQTCFSTPFHNIVYGPNAKKNLAEGCADFILNQPIKDSNNQRKSAICSSFAAMTFQIGQLYESIRSVELETLKN